MERTSTLPSFSVTISSGYQNSEKKSSSERIVKEEICVLFNFFAFLTKFVSAKVTKFARFGKKKTVAEKICNARGNYGPLVNQSERAYYRSHSNVATGHPEAQD